MDGTDRPDVLIVGGGLVGLATAYYLSKRSDLQVAVLDRGEFGRGASWAAAGMLAAQCEVKEPGPLLTLGLAGRALYDHLAPELFNEVGVAIEHVQCGILRVARSPEERGALQDQLELQRSLGLRVEWLEPNEVRAREPHLSEGLCGAMWLPDDGQVNNRKLVQALTTACLRKGVRLIEKTEVTSWITSAGVNGSSGGQVLGVQTPSGPMHAGSVVLATGAWSRQLAAGLGVSLPVFPVKGQVLALRAPSEPIRQIVFASGTCYLVPKVGGRLLIGATEEHAQFDERPTVGGTAALAHAALELSPEVSELSLLDSWGGLRPATPDQKPILGPVPEWEGLYVATGHYRNGILLSPISGMTVAHLICGEPAPVNWRPFALDRFDREEERPRHLVGG